MARYEYIVCPVMCLTKVCVEDKISRIADISCRLIACHKRNFCEEFNLESRYEYMNVPKIVTRAKNVAYLYCRYLFNYLFCYFCTSHIPIYGQIRELKLTENKSGICRNKEFGVTFQRNL